MTARAERLLERYFGGLPHPYRILEEEVQRLLRPEDALLDAGCGRGAPVLSKFRGRARTLIGVDLVDFNADIPGVALHQCDLGRMDIDSGIVDLVMSRSVMEHVADPPQVYAEIHRILRPGGHFVFLTPNLWDYASIIAKCVPNRLHPWFVARTEGRAPEDVFPVFYKTNTRGAVSRWARQSGFDFLSIRYLGQYPAYFMFNAALFYVATGYEKLISRFEGLRFLRGWILVVLRKPSPSPGDRTASSTQAARAVA